jgi:hypothetical protein
MTHKAAMSAPIKRDLPKPIPTAPTLWQRIKGWLCAIFWIAP